MPASATIEQLIALNREIAALVRAGVPLEQGLQRVGSVGGEADSALSMRLSRRIEQGASLADSLTAEGEAVPAAYRAIVAAGQRAGRLPEALETVAELAESMQELRRRIRLSTIYPLLVAGLAYGLLVLGMFYIVPQFSQMAASMRLPPGRVLPAIEWLQQRVHLWGPALPILAIVCYFGSAVIRGSGIGPLLGLSGRLTDWLPGVSRIRQNLRRGWHCRLLASLLQHQVPLPEALELAGDALGPGPLQESSRQLATELRTGRSLAAGLAATPEFSPLTRWMMSAGETGPELVNTLQRGAELMLSRARRQAQVFQSLWPVVAVVVVGGGAALVYALTLFGPLVELLHRLSVEPFV